jgi:competence protein ComEC
VKIVTPPAAPGAWLTLGAYVQGVRDAIDGRIRSVLAGDPGAIASAVITGKRDAISPAVYDAMFVSGIGHVLSISGYRLSCFPQEGAGQCATLAIPRQDVLCHVSVAGMKLL